MKAREIYVSLLMTVGPMFFLQCMIRISSQEDSCDNARIWYGSKFGVLLFRILRWLRIFFQNNVYLFLISLGIFHSLGSYSEGT